MTPVQGKAISVSYTVSEGAGDYVAATDEGAGKMVDARYPWGHRFTIPTVNDSADEADGTVTITLNPGMGYTVGTASTASSTIYDDDGTQKYAIGLTVAADTSEGGMGTDTYREITFSSTPAFPSDRAPFSLDLCVGGTAKLSDTDYQIVDSHGSPEPFNNPTPRCTKNTLKLDNAPFSIKVIGDDDIEPDETVILTLQKRSTADTNGNRTFDDIDVSATMGTYTYTILTDDTNNPDVTITAGTSPVTEGTAATFTVSANPAPMADLPVTLAVADAPGADFVSASNEGTGKTVTILARATSAPYDVPTAGDSADEPNGPVTVTVASGTGYDVGSPSAASVTVNDGDATTVTLTTPDKIMREDDIMNTASLTVTLNRGLVSGEKLVVPLSLSGAVLGSDYTTFLSGAPSGVTLSGLTLSGATLTFTGPSMGATATAATVTLTAVDEAGTTNETLTASLGTLTATNLGGGATGSRIGDGEIMIIDDDVTYVLSVRVSPDSVEGNAGVSYREVFFETTPARPPSFPRFYFNVCFSGDADLRLTSAQVNAGVKLDYAMHSARFTTSTVATGNTAAGCPEGLTVATNAFQSDWRYFIGVKGDGEVEPDETVTIAVRRLTSGGNPTPSDVSISSTAGSATYTILNDDTNDPEITIAAGPSPVTEGASATFTVTASPALMADLPVNLTVADAPHSDFVAAANEGMGKTATIAANATSAMFAVATAGDSMDEPDGPVTVTVETGNGYTVGSASAASVTVSDNDTTTVTLSGAAGDLVEGGAKDILLTLGRGLRQGETLTAPLTFAGAATRNSDYALSCPSPLPMRVTCSNLNSGSAEVAFIGPATGMTATSVTIALAATPDNVAEATAETVQIGLGALTSTGLGGAAKGVDNLADFSIADPVLPTATFAAASSSAAEDAGAHNVGVTLNPAPTANVTLNYTVGGTATSATDYAALTGTVAVASGATTVNIPVAITDDAAVEGAETVELTLAAGMGYAVGSANVHTLTIQDNDAPPTVVTITAGAAPVAEGTTTTFTVRSSPAPVVDLPVNLTVADAPGADFVLAASEGPRTVTIAANAATATIAVATEADGADEPSGPVTVTVASGVGYTAGSANAAHVVVRDDDPTLVTLGTTGPIPREGDSDDTSEFFLDLGRELVADEALAIPVVFSGGVRNTDFTAELKDAPSGVDFAWSTTQWSTATFTGPSARQATFALIALADDDETDDQMTISIPASSFEGDPRMTATNLDGGAKSFGRASWGVILLDDDATNAPGIAESPGRLNLVEGGAAGRYTVRLRSRPAGAVTVTATSAEPDKLGVHASGGAPGASATLAFGPTDWHKPQALTATAFEDADDEDELIEMAHAVTGTGDYDGLSPGPVVVFVADDEGDTRLPAPPPTPPVVPPPVIPPPVVPPPPSAPEVTLSASPNPAFEGETITVVAALSEALATDVAIPLALTAGTAEAGDYEPLASIAIAANETSGTGGVVTNVDNDADDETFTVALGDLPGGVQPGSPSSIELTITETRLIVSAEGEDEIPEAFALEQNYPNPFNPSTTIRFALDKAQRVRLMVYDLLGQEVRVLVDGVRPAARYDVAFDAADLASGTYLYVLRAESQVAVKTMLLLK